VDDIAQYVLKVDEAGLMVALPKFVAANLAMPRPSIWPEDLYVWVLL